MSAPVWILSVDLQTKTATFQSGMADAAKSARGAFSEIKSGSGDMGREVGFNMMESRHGVMLLGEEFGIHLPRALTSFIASIGPVGAAMEAAFPFLAIAVGATLLIEALVKMHEAGEKLTQDQMHFVTSVQTAFNALDQKLLESGIKTDELRNDHLGALAKKLELINQQSMAELAHSFEEVAKSADVVFADLQSHWYTFGIGSSGAKHALTDFKSEYDKLLAQGKDKEASDLLRGTRESAEKTLAMQKQAKDALAGQSGKAGTDIADQLKYAEAKATLQKAGVGWTQKEVEAQQTLVDALNAQVNIEGKVAALKKSDSSNATASTGKEMGAMRAEAARQAAEHTQKMGELSLAAEKEQAAVSLTIHQATIAQRLASDLALADKEYAIQLQGNAQLISALDKGGKDYQNQLKALQSKTEEITAQHNNTLKALQGKASEEQFRKDLQDFEQAEREKIDATEQGSKQRLAVLDASIKEEQSRNMQDTQHYRELLTQRVQTATQAGIEEAKQAAVAGKLAADSTLKMGEMSLAAEREQTALRNSLRHVSAQTLVEQEIDQANKEYALKLTAAAQEMAALDKSGKDYENKLRELQAKEKQLIQQHENDVTSVKEKAEIERNSKIMSAEQAMNNTIASGLTQVIMGHKSFASMMASIGDQVVSGLIQNAIKSIMAHKMTQIPDAAAAARAAYLSGVEAGGPAAPLVGALYGAEAFAAMMAFEGGGVVPGVGRGDIVPAMLTPGEGVVPGGVMDKLSAMARSGNMGGGPSNVMSYRPTFHMHNIDQTGVKKMLDTHTKEFSQHFANELRRMNR